MGFSAPDHTVTIRLEGGEEVTVGAADVARQSPHPIPTAAPVRAHAHACSVCMGACFRLCAFGVCACVCLGVCARACWSASVRVCGRDSVCGCVRAHGRLARAWVHVRLFV